MRIIILVFMAFALLGALDTVLGHKLGLGQQFLNGLDAMGKLCFSMCGIYCGATAAGQFFATAMPPDSGFNLPLAAGMLLSTDMGGWAVAKQMAQTPQQAWFSGALVASTLGCLISFVLPVSLGGLPKQEHTAYLQGVSKGIAPLPLALAAGGLLCGVPWQQLLWELVPLTVLCVGLVAVLRFAPDAGLVVLKSFGVLMQLLGGVLFCLLAAGQFVPQLQVFEQQLFFESLSVVFNITVVVCGALIVSGLMLRFWGGGIRRMAALLRINEYAAAGLIASLISSVSMLPMYNQMDSRGRQMNAAFSVAGAFILGGQMAFVADTTPAQTLTAFFVCKLLGGVLAVMLVRNSKIEQISSDC